MTDQPFAVDYTSRDYTSIRADMINQIAIKLPEWTDHSSNDFGIALIELFAYSADIMSYYADRIANEAYLQTATQRANVLTIAKMLDYTPGGNIAAQATVTLTNTNTGSVTVPVGTQVSTSTGTLVFETQSAVTVAGSGTANVLVAQGVTIASEAVGTSNGGLNQDFTLFQTPVIDNSIKLYVDSGSGPVPWTRIEHLIDAGPTSLNYSTYTDASDIVHIVFGDNVSGSIPVSGAAITATYRTGGGVAGNVGPNTINRFVSAVAAGVSVNNSAAASGGADEETLDSIRTNAPKSLFSLQRAVTLTDYNQLAIRVPGVAKANSVSAVYSSVTTYVAPTNGGGVSTTDGVTPTAQLTATMGSVSTYMAPLIPASTTLTVAPPTYVPINVTVGVQVLSNYGQDTTRTAVVAALNNYFSFDNVSFAQRVSLADMYSLIASVPGVQYSTPTVLSRTGSGLTDVQLAANEIPIGYVITTGATTITVTASGGIVTT